MEAKINIAEILKSKSRGTKLYSLVFGQMTYESLGYGGQKIWLLTKDDIYKIYYSDGKYREGGEVTLYPSKEMRDWSKFAWKKGDALSCGVDNLCIFEKWANEEYTEFYAKFVTPNYSGNTFKTEKWSKETNEAVIKQYISNIEEFKGGKLNLTTLEIEKTQPEFNDGDILYVKTKKLGSEYIIINKLSEEAKTTFYVAYNLSSKNIFWNLIYFVCCDKEISILRQATDYEKSQLFDALAKKNKAWDSEKKAIVDLKPKWTPKPFDRVITRNDDDDIWTANIFSHMDSYGKYVTIGCVGSYPYCLPYNEETAKLIGTTNNWES